MTSHAPQNQLSRRKIIGAAGAAMTGTTLLAAEAQDTAGLPALEGTAVTPAIDSSLLCGWATTSITPDIPVQLAGQFAERVSQKVLEPCMATAMALEGAGPDGSKEQAVLVSCDVVHIPEELVQGVRERVARDLPS